MSSGQAIVVLVFIAVALIAWFFDMRENKRKGIHPLIGWMVYDKDRVIPTEPKEENWPFSNDKEGND